MRCNWSLQRAGQGPNEFRVLDEAVEKPIQLLTRPKAVVSGNSPDPEWHTPKAPQLLWHPVHTILISRYPTAKTIANTVYADLPQCAKSIGVKRMPRCHPDVRLDPFRLEYLKRKL